MLARGHSWLVTFAALAVMGVGGCHTTTPPTPDAGEPIKINIVPTGTIKTPSLCDRVQVDARVTTVGIDSFAFVWSVDHYQVVYADLAAHALYAVRLSESGVPLEPPVLVEPGGSRASAPFILPTSTGYTVVWEESTTPARSRVTALGDDRHTVGERGGRRHRAWTADATGARAFAQRHRRRVDGSDREHGREPRRGRRIHHLCRVAR